MTRNQRRGVTLTDVIAVVVFVVLLLGLVSIMLQGFNGPPPSSQSICSANLGGTGKGFAMYAVANNDWWPIAVHKMPAATQPGGEVTYVRRIGAKRGGLNQPSAGETTRESTEVSTTRAFWLLVRTGASSPKSFICPSSRDEPNEEDNPTDYWDFGKGDQVSEGMGKQDPAANGKQVSYGYQVPFGRVGRPNGDADNGMAMVADKGPYGAWLDAGRGGDPGAPSATVSGKRDEWAKWNSVNHGGDGQNVLYPDAHVEFHETPLAGVNKENIYTQWSSFTPDENGRLQGKPPTLAGREVPMGETDSLIYP